MPEAVWDILIDTRIWPIWGPSLLHVDCNDRYIKLSSKGRVKTVFLFWRNFWDVLFFVGSTLAASLFGVAVGAVIQGLKLSELGDYQGTLLEMLSGFSISVGLFTVALLTMHGAIYLYLKTEGELQQRLFTWMKTTYYLYLAMFVIVTLWSILFVPASLQHFGEYPILWLVPLLNITAITNIPRAIARKKLCTHL